MQLDEPITLPLILAATASFVGAVALHIISSYVHDYDPAKRVKRFLKTRECIKEFKTIYIKDEFLPKQRSKFGPVLHYVREGKKFSRSSRLPFEYFAKKHTPIESFKAFLIPPLDNGHGNQRESSSQVGEINKGWFDYFNGIGAKMDEISPHAKEHPGRRIIFFEKFFLDLFLSNPSFVVERSGINNDGTLSAKNSPREADPIAQFFRNVIHTIYHIVTIHHVNSPFSKSICTYYVDKGKIQSNRYYDFGLYKMPNANVIYMPLFQKDIYKTVVGDKIYISETRAQCAGIAEFEEDFDSLWALCTDARSTELRVTNSSQAYSQTRTRHRDLLSFLHEFFGRTYYTELRTAFEEKLGVSWAYLSPI